MFAPINFYNCLWKWFNENPYGFSELECICFKSIRFGILNLSFVIYLSFVFLAIGISGYRIKSGMTKNFGLPRYYSPLTNSLISLTARSIPTKAALETMLWPMRYSSISDNPLKALMVL